MEEKKFTIDDVFLLADAMTKKLHELGNQKGIEEKIATAMLNASDPDSAFKADIAMKISTVMSLIEMLITYINKPVVAEGIMQWKMDGSVMIGVNPVPIGSLVEFWKEEKWNLGKLIQNPKTKQCQIIDPIGQKVLVDKIEQLKARVR